MTTAQRDPLAGIARPAGPLNPLLLNRPPVYVRVTVPQFLREVRKLDDRRQYRNIRRIAPLAALSRKATRIIPKVSNSFGVELRTLPHRQRFVDPRQIALCVRRRARKEVIHAIGFARGGKGRPRKKPRRNFWSEISC